VVARRSVVREIVDADLSGETDRSAGHQRLAMMHAGAVDGVARGEVVAAVEDDVDGGNQRIERGARQPLLQGNDFDIRVDRGQRLAA